MSPSSIIQGSSALPVMAKRVMQAMLQMVKIDIEGLWRAYDND